LKSKSHKKYKQEVADLTSALTNFGMNQDDDERKAVGGAFVNLIEQPADARYTKTSRKYMYHAADDFRGLLYALHLFKTSLSNVQDDGSHALASRAHVQLFFSDFRAILDHLLSATLIVFRQEINRSSDCFAKKFLKDLRKKNSHRPSFGSFIKALRKNRINAESGFPPSLVRLWLKSTWLNEVGTLRDGIVHEGYFVAVNNEDARGFFRIETTDRIYPLKRLNLPRSFYGYDGTALEFSLFTGIYCGRLLIFLNSWASEIAKFCRHKPGRRAYSGLGSTALFGNISQALRKLSK